MKVNISTTVYSSVSRPIHDVYEYFIPIDLVDILVGWGPLPRVVSTSGQTGPWDIVGSRRTVHLADGSTASEQVTHYAADKMFGYTVSQFTNPIRYLAQQAKGVWVFSAPSSSVTQISWTYTYQSHNLLAGIVLYGVVKLLWKRYMQRAIDRFVELAAKK